MDRANVVVIGAGLIGSSIAWRLAQAGRRVMLLDRGEPGAEASWAGAGLLQPEAGREASSETLGLWLESLAMYDEFVRELRAATGAAFEYRVCGRLVVALSEGEEEALRARAAAQASAGIAHEWIAGEDVRRMEPAITPEVRAAIFYPRHGLVDNRRMGGVLAQAAARAGAEVRPHEAALSVAVVGGRVVGVATTSARIAADVVVNAAGCWSGLLATGSDPGRVDRRRAVESAAERPEPSAAGDEWIVRPARGEIIALEARPRPIERVISTSDASVSARGDGRIVVGATVIRGSARKEISARGVARMLAAATRAVPSLSEARFVEAWSGLRPESRDEQPVVGEDAIAGLYWATGHFKMGILSTPATAEVIASLVEGKRPRVPISSMSPRRFER